MIRGGYIISLQSVLVKLFVPRLLLPVRKLLPRLHSSIRVLTRISFYDPCVYVYSFLNDDDDDDDDAAAAADDRGRG